MYQQKHRKLLSPQPYNPFLDSVILQLDQRFSGHAEAVMRLSSILLPNVITAYLCKIEPAVNVFLPLL